MVRDERTDVLVVGAGPVGMLTALLLARGGVSVRIIDQESRTASRNYACALHPASLGILERLGLDKDVLASGHKVSTVAWYEGASRRAEARLSQLAGRYPFVVVLPQSRFEELLEQRLKGQGGPGVEWNHQLSGWRAEADGIAATVDKLGVSAKGYIVPEMEWAVEKTIEVHTRYLVGADGPNSRVAESLQVGSESVGEPEFYAVYEFQSDWAVRDELRVVLAQDTSSVLWPLPDNKFRWSFQLREEHLAEFPSKDRQALVVDEPALEKANRAFMQKLIGERAPWFKGSIETISWSTDVEFQHRVARRFGQGGCWLVGDAAHQTSPAGMQSMNHGLLEAEQLASALIRIRRENGSPELLEAYDQAARQTWRRLLGLGSPLKSRPETESWVRDRSERVLRCIPASGEDLRQMLIQLRLDWA